MTIGLFWYSSLYCSDFVSIYVLRFFDSGFPFLILGGFYFRMQKWGNRLFDSEFGNDLYILYDYTVPVSGFYFLFFGFLMN